MAALVNTGGVQTQFSTDPNAIVTVHVSIIEAPTPINYQRTGALVSFGATTLPAGWTELLTELADLAVPPLDNPTGSPIMPVAYQGASLTWAAGVCTLTLTTPMSFPKGGTTPGMGPPINGDIIPMVLTGYVPNVFTNTPL